MVGCDFIFPPNEPTQYKIEVIYSRGGSISPSNEVKVIKGKDATFTITPDGGYVVDALKIDGVATASASTYTFKNVTSDHKIEATFKTKDKAKCYITVTSTDGGTISPSGTVEVSFGGNATLTITPSSGYNVDVFKVNDIAISLSNPEYFLNGNVYLLYNVTVDTKVYVSFRKYSWSIESISEQGGTISPNGVTQVRRQRPVFFNPLS